jgi:hypothetical protein
VRCVAEGSYGRTNLGDIADELAMSKGTHRSSLRSGLRLDRLALSK